MHYIFCVSGFSGVGKDEFCRRLVYFHGAIHTGLADPAKRHMAEVYGFTRDQLFGPSEMRNAGDPRFVKNTTLALSSAPCDSEFKNAFPDATQEDLDKIWWYFEIPNEKSMNSELMKLTDDLPRCRGRDSTRFFFTNDNPKFFLSPRESLQLYCDLMNQLYVCTWINKGIDIHRRLAVTWDNYPMFIYDRMLGLLPNDGSRKPMNRTITCFSDFRHRHEIEYTKTAARIFNDFKPIFVRVKRPGIEKPPFDHRSEVEQTTIPDREFDFVVNNDGTLVDLYGKVDSILNSVVKADAFTI